FHRPRADGRRLPRAGISARSPGQRTARAEARRQAGAGGVPRRGRQRADQAAAQDERGPDPARAGRAGPAVAAVVGHPALAAHRHLPQAVMQIYVGTSGYLYKHWNTGIFYPRGVKDRLAYALARMTAMEINSSFYRIPPP